MRFTLGQAYIGNYDLYSEIIDVRVVKTWQSLAIPTKVCISHVTSEHIEMGRLRGRRTWC